MQSKAATVSEYLKELPDDRRQALTKLRALIRKTAPGVKETMMYGMAGYSLAGVPIFALASQKGYMALYCDTQIVAAHRKGLGKLNCGKSCVRFKRFDELPLHAIKAILKESYRRQRAKLRSSVTTL